MRVGFRDLTAWSFLMATAHGAGLMLVPVVLRLAPRAVAHAAAVQPMPMQDDHAHHMMMAAAPVAVPAAELVAVTIHTAAMFLVMAVVGDRGLREDRPGDSAARLVQPRHTLGSRADCGRGPVVRFVAPLKR